MEPCLGGMVPLGVAVLISIVFRREPCLDRSQQAGEAFTKEVSVPRALIDLPRETSQQRDAEDPAPLPRRAGSPVEGAVRRAGGQKVADGSLASPAPTGAPAALA
jgi:hypothetical protein